jgi:hypothetical protein
VADLLADVIETDHWGLNKGNSLRPLIPCNAWVEAYSVQPTTLMTLEILHVALVLFGSPARFEGSEVTSLAGFRVHFAGIEPIFTGP